VNSLDAQGVMDVEQRRLAGVYEKLPLVITRGKGAVLWDIDGREYVDCMGAYGVGVVGHCHPRIVAAVKEQAERLIACHGSIYNDARAEFLEKLFKVAPRFDKAFLSNSGAEAVECALKLARKYTGKPEVIAMMGSYHGKTMGALSLTWNPKYRDPFQPLLPEVKFVPFGNIEKLRESLTEKTAAVIAEPIQGESGVRMPPEGYIKALRETCDEKEVLLIFDEVQTGLGRTGRMWASEHVGGGAAPDIMCLAKGVAGGLPLGVTLAREEVMASLGKGEHSSTFGGNPLVCAAASATLDVIQEENLPKRASELGGLFKEGLQRLQQKYRVVREIRGLGLMLAMDLRFNVKDVLLEAVNRGAIFLYSGRTTLRFLPPLVIEKQQVDFANQVLDELLAKEEGKMVS